MFSILRALIEEFRGEEDSRLGLVGAFGYDLLFQFEPIEKKLPRAGHKDLHLFLCDDIWFMDRKKEQIERYQYDFERDGAIHARPGARRRRRSAAARAARARPDRLRPHAGRVHGQCGEGARRHAPRRLLRGGAAPDLPHAVLRQGLDLFERVQRASPSPYEFLLQFGDEQLVGASPEMFVRVEGARVETCPISGTAQRTGDPLRDADNIRELLKSHQGRIRADHVHGRGPQRQVARLRAGHGEGDRAAADRILRRRVPHGGPRGGHS